MKKPQKQKATKGLWLRGGVYWFAGTVAGERIRVSLKTSDLGEALQLSKEVKLFPERFKKKRDGSMLEEFLAHQSKRGISFAHLKQARAVLEDVETVTGVRIEDLSGAAASRWWGLLLKRVNPKTSEPVKPKTTKDYLAHVTVFFKWAMESGRVKLSPVAEIVPPKVRPSVRKSFLKPEDALRALDLCEDEEMKFCMFCALHCGLRRGEVIASRPHWFDLKAGLLHIQNESDWLIKDRENRTIPLTSEFLAFLKVYGIRKPYMYRPAVKDNPDKKAWAYRTDFKKAFTKHMKALGLSAYTFHDLRRTFASLHVSRGTPLYHVAKWLGDHPNVVEQTYGHLLPNDARINDPWTQAREATTISQATG